MDRERDGRFARMKQQASAKQLYALLFAMPKGADLHVHLSGCGTPADWYELATGNGAFWVRAVPTGCGHDQRSGPVTIRRAALQNLPGCCQAGWVPLGSLTDQQRHAWAARLSLQHPHLDPTRFFHVTGELKHLRKDPVLLEALLLRVLRRAAAEGVRYLEVQTGPFGYVDAAGEPEPVAEMVQRYRHVLDSPAARATGVTTRLVVNVSRTVPDVRQRLRTSFAMASRHPDVWVGVQLSGQEDQASCSLDQLRSVYGSLRQRYPMVRVAVHAGEGFGDGNRVAGAVAVGARRIGHGLNLIHEPDTVARVRDAGLAVEVSMG